MKTVSMPRSSAADHVATGNALMTAGSVLPLPGSTSLAFAAALMLAFTGPAFAQEEEEESPISVSAAFNSDAFFGVNPFVGLAYDTGDIDVTFYGIYWGAGTGQDWGNWTEFGVGAGWEAMGGDLYINPQLGFTFGNLLSSGTEEPGIVGDGIVPNITLNYDTENWEGQFYFGWYLPLRDEAPQGGTTLEYIHYWLNGGRKFKDYFSVGAHFEELRLSGGSDVVSQDGYQWLGPYFQIGTDKVALRVAFGADLTDDDDSFSDSDFYKLQFFYNF